MLSTIEAEITSLYSSLLDAWDRQDAAGFASLFDGLGSVVGFDGTIMSGPTEIEASLRAIFSHHATPTYVSIVREIRVLSLETVLLRAVAGMVPRGQLELNPELNAVQSLVAVNEGSSWRAALFQTTPAAFHGRPGEAEVLTEELRAAAGFR